MLITRISGCKGKTFLLNRKDLDEIKYNFYKKVDSASWGEMGVERGERCRKVYIIEFGLCG